MNKKTIVCLPTYNEAENLPKMTAAILYHIPRASVLVVDDNSPDGTGDIADRLARKDERVMVMHRTKKQGLGKAYNDGFKYILENHDAELVIQMDADFSHSPDNLRGMISAAKKADLVIGSRYVDGGGIENWGFVRKMVSRAGSIYARKILQIPVKDMTGGFKLWKSELLKEVVRHPIGSGGYAFQVETTFIAHRLGAVIVETPIVFADRRAGHSKMSIPIALEAGWRVPLLRIQSKCFFANTVNNRNL